MQPDPAMLAPIVLFVYNRPVHTKRTVDALLKNALAAESDLCIYSDAPKRPEVAEAVREVRAYIKTITGFSSITIVERERNLGLANSIIDGVTSIVNKHGRIIVLEDDLVVSQYFLEYMNTALERYRDDDRVMQISGHMFPTEFLATTDAVFLPMATSWGWATWARAWQHFDPKSQGVAQLRADSQLRRRFNLDGAYNYFTMLESQLTGQIDSWAVRWNLSVFLRDGLILYPRTTLVTNIGFDGSGTHCGPIKNMKGDKATLGPKSTERISFPSSLQVNQEAYYAVKRFLGRAHGSWVRRKLARLMR